MSRFRDFDAFLAEQQAEPLEFRYGGRVYRLPAQMPALIPLRLAQLMDTPDSEVPPKVLVEIAHILLGEQLDDLLAQGISIDHLSEIIQWAMTVYTGASETKSEQASDESGEPKKGA